jgi:Tn3 transposase DDE domain-containing protein
VAHGILAENTCDDQRKLIKCNDLVSDRLIFYNLFALTRAMYKLKRERVHLSAEALFRLRPYLTSHINRLGVYISSLTACHRRLATNCRFSIY